ncbi:MAG: hypothetical protein GY950_12700 [bacterium]|nr:hypothetical protein [bacterium]
MKRISLFLTLLVAVSLSVGFAASEKKDIGFHVKSNGKVVVNDMEYENMSSYYQSRTFVESGRRCGTVFDPMMMEAVPSDCSTSQTVIQGEYWPSDVYVIPVVFHVIYKTDGTGNIPDSRLYNQLEVLNEDYRAIAGSLGEPGYDTHVQFDLAGITRTENDNWHNDNNEYQYKNALGWDQDQYLNIYVNSASGYLGYAYFPQTSAGTVLDGVVALYSAVGGRDEGNPPYNQGRTVTHEVGHYLGLYHTFQGGCGTGYTAGDLIADTNPESTSHFNCVQTNTCSSPDPIHNYMNYTDDLCMYEFTSEQSNRAVCSLVNYRPSLYSVQGGGDTEIFISNIKMKLKVDRQGRHYARGIVTVKDTDGNVIPGASVSITWTGIVRARDTQVTNGRGKYNFKSPKTTAAAGTFTLTVTDVSASGYVYNPALNVETSDSISF